MNKILISKSKRKILNKDKKILGMSGENLQEVLFFSLDEKTEGTGIIEVELPDETKGMIEVLSTGEGYELPVKSSLLKQPGFVKFQLKIVQNKEEIFKSDIVELEVRESINATETIPDQYPTWIDNLEKLKQDLEQSEKERQLAEKTRQEEFSEMQKDVSDAVNNIKDLTEEYNTNAEQKTKEFDTNVTSKLDSYNNNDIAKTKAYNDNATLKEKAYNDNATDKIKEYNLNTEQKEKELEELAKEKINEYNQVSAELVTKIEQLQTENEQLKSENQIIKNQIPLRNSKRKCNIFNR